MHKEKTTKQQYGTEYSTHLRNASLEHHLLERQTVVVSRGDVAHEQVALTAEQHLQPGDEVFGEGAAQVATKLGENAGQILGLNVLIGRR